MAINSVKDVCIKNSTTFKIGGKIKEIFYPQSVQDFLSPQMPKNALVIGNLSNTLVSTFGYDGEIISSAKLDYIKIEDTKVTVGAGVKGPMLSQKVFQSGLSGLEFMIGFPGSIGGEVYMNASANSQAVSDFLVCVTCFSPSVGIVKIPKDEMGFDYRTSRCEKDKLTVIEAEFNLPKAPTEEIQAKMDEFLAFRKSHQPSLALPNCGSIFKNPPGNSAGKLLDSIGAKNMSVGGAKVWENHANFIVNHNNATSIDVLKLMYLMQNKVQSEYNIKLEPEIKFLGGKNNEENELWEILNKK